MSADDQTRIYLLFALVAITGFGSLAVDLQYGTRHALIVWSASVALLMMTVMYIVSKQSDTPA